VVQRQWAYYRLYVTLTRARRGLWIIEPNSQYLPPNLSDDWQRWLNSWAESETVPVLSLQAIEEKPERLEAEGDYLKASQLYEQAGMTADAGRCYEKAGDTKSATRCRAKQAEQVGQPLQAAQYYEQATMYKDAGRCYYQASRYADAGRCYEQARNYRKAAECYKLAGMYAEAARCEAMAAPPTPPPGSSGCVLVLLWQLHQPLLPALQGACWCC